MGDSEPVAAQTSAVADYPSKDHASTDYCGANSTSYMEGGAYKTGTVGDTTSSLAPTDVVYPLPDGTSLVDGNAYSMDSNAVTQEVPHGANYEAKPTVEVTVSSAVKESAAAVSAHALGSDSANGNGIAETKDFTVAGNGENGNVSSDSVGPVTEQQFEEGSVSTEEDRLWGIIRADCLDFNAWTALIQETEKVAEDNLLKIRKVYDAFLAEFPLCYGYWKKYADHEARLGNVDKIVEVYERAVLAVTYSLDIWLHYCMFAISTYGDPDTIRSVSPIYGGRFAGDAL